MPRSRPPIPVLFVHHRSELGGAPESLSYLIRELDRERFEPHVYCPPGPAADLFREAVRADRPWREATTLVAVLTDARLTKTEAWLVARAASAGVARAVSPSATSFDGGSPRVRGPTTSGRG